MRLRGWIDLLAAQDQSAIVSVAWPTMDGYDYSDQPFAGLLTSYRGYYDHLALTPSRQPRVVGELLNDARMAVGKTFQGWKGGDYWMDDNTPVWAADAGDTPGLGIAGVVVTIAGVTVQLVDVNDYPGWGW